MRENFPDRITTLAKAQVTDPKRNTGKMNVKKEVALHTNLDKKIKEKVINAIMRINNLSSIAVALTHDADLLQKEINIIKNELLQKSEDDASYEASQIKEEEDPHVGQDDSTMDDDNEDSLDQQKDAVHKSSSSDIQPLVFDESSVMESEIPDDANERTEMVLEDNPHQSNYTENVAQPHEDEKDDLDDERMKAFECFKVRRLCHFLILIITFFY
jgi:hypothetical protein